ncbi:MAG: ElyC/SanA/YdcF family protein [Bacteroidota bacterium]
MSKIRRKRIHKIKKPILKLFLMTCFGLFLIWVNYVTVSNSTTQLLYNNSNDIPKSEYALLLGTPKYLPSGNINNYYKNRIVSAAKLYSEDKIQKIIISADTLNKYGENEVELIKLDLVQTGVNELDLILDNDGHRTWNSIRYLIGFPDTDKFILISQKFHLKRALYISEKKNINAIGFIAKGEISNKLWLREVLARLKMRLDLTTSK